MLEVTDPDSALPPEKVTGIKKAVSHLKLVVSSSSPPQEQPSIDYSNLAGLAPFKAHIEAKGQNLYSLNVQDASHFIGCTLPLSVKEAEDEHKTSSVTCYFPKIDDNRLYEFTQNDETLYGILIIRFQMNILEQLLLFCADHHADSLFIMAAEKQVEELEIYRGFVLTSEEIMVPQDKIPGNSSPLNEGIKNGNKKSNKVKMIKMLISASHKNYDAWLDHAEKTNFRFTQTLWNDQRANPVIQSYLKTHSLVSLNSGNF